MPPTALKRQDEAIGRQAKLKKQLEKTLEAVTATVALRWPEDGGKFNRDAPLLVPETALTQWFEEPPPPTAWPGRYLGIRPTTGTLPSTRDSDPSDRVKGVAAPLPHGRRRQPVAPLLPLRRGRQYRSDRRSAQRGELGALRL